MTEMVRDSRDVWPSDVPIGTFDIEGGPGHGVGGYPWAFGHIIFVCPNGRRCGGLIGPVPHEKDADHQCYTWGWDGNLEKPTLTPSFNCVGGCGWHGHITAGVMR